MSNKYKIRKTINQSEKNKLNLENKTNSIFYLNPKFFQIQYIVNLYQSDWVSDIREQLAP